MNYFAESCFGELQVATACEDSAMSISCDEGTLLIVEGKFRRTSTQVCPHHSITSNPNCYSVNSLQHIRTECEGKTSCSVPATNSFFGDDPCYEIKKYVETTYRCQLCG